MDQASAGALVENLMKAQPLYPNDQAQQIAAQPSMTRRPPCIRSVSWTAGNIRVRRAGFCLQKYLRKVVERFYLLSPKYLLCGEYLGGRLAKGLRKDSDGHWYT